MRSTNSLMKMPRNFPGVLLGALSLMSLGLAACDDSSWVLAQAQKEAAQHGKPVPGDKQGGGKDPAPTCVDQVQGSDTSCKDVGTWKMAAWQGCDDKGLALSSYLTKQECGKDLFRSVSYSCCPKAATPPPPPQDKCVTQSQGDDTSCKDTGTWKQSAWQACDGQGMALSAYTTAKSCGTDSFRSVSYTCCPKAAPPPPPTTKSTQQIKGSSSTCKDAVAWKQIAAQTCESQKLQLVDYTHSMECGTGGYRYVLFTCSGPSDSTGDISTVPGPAQFIQYKCCKTDSDCIVEIQGDEAVCKDAPTFKTAASASCESKGRALQSYGLYGACKI
jgi:hypothetical protein